MAVKFSRRAFIRTAAAALAGTVLLRGLPMASAQQEKEGPPELPWPYKRLDPDYVRKLAHLGYYLFECAGGSFWGLVTALREAVGYPWTLLPLPSKEEALKALKEGRHLHSMYQYGYGGVVGWGTVCGALNGSISIIQMVVKEHKDWDKLGKLLMRWYEATPLPTEKSNEMAVRGEFLVPPEKMKYRGPLPQSISHSTLCHVSVGRWCRVSGYASGSKERSERCARLTGDVAAMAAQLLNAYFYGGGIPAAEAVARVSLSATTAGCRTCHYKGKDYEQGQFTRGYLECEACHRDMTPHAHAFIKPSVMEKEMSQTTANEKRLKAAAVTGAGLSAVMGAVAGFAAAKGLSSGNSNEKKEKKE